MNTVLPPTDQQVASMRQQVMTEIVTVTKRRRRRAGLTLGAALLGTVALTGGAFAVTQASVQSRNNTVECFTVADLGAEHATATLADNDADTGNALTPTQQRVQNAIAQCEAGWNAVPTDADAPALTVDVPHPTACQLGDGRLAVFPNQDDESTLSFCAGLELAVPSS